MAVAAANDLVFIDVNPTDLEGGLGWILQLSGDSCAYCFVIT